MKLKLSCLLVLVAVAFNANAQTEKGQNLIGISGLHTWERTNTLLALDKKTETQISINYGHFIHKNLALGITASYNSKKTFIQSDYLLDLVTFYALSHAYSDTKTKYIALGPYLRYYIDISNKFKFYSEFTANIGLGTQSNEYISPNRKTYSGNYTNYTAALNAGLAYYPTKRISVELGFNVVSYTNSTADYKDASNERIQKVNFGLNSFRPVVGVNFHF